MDERSRNYLRQQADEAAALSLWDAGIVRPDVVAQEAVAHLRSEGWQPATETAHEIYSALANFASRHSASLHTAAQDPRAPSFGDDWCAFVALVRGMAEPDAH